MSRLIMWRKCLFFILFLWAMGVPTAVDALVIFPGEFVDQIPAEYGSTSKSSKGTGRLNQGHIPAVDFAYSKVKVRLPLNRISLEVGAGRCILAEHALAIAQGKCKVGPYRSGATGRLFVDICVPLVGKTTCDPGDDGPSVNTTIAFDAAHVGRMNTFGPAAKTSFQVDAIITDTGVTPNHTVAFQPIVNKQLGKPLGSWTVIAKVPVPLPEFSRAELTTRRQFVTVLRRGHQYRFQLRANATATSGLQTAFVSFLAPLPGVLPIAGYIELNNLAIDVAADTQPSISSALLETLQKQIAELSSRVDAALTLLDASGSQTQSQLEELAATVTPLPQLLNALAARTAGVEQGQVMLDADLNYLDSQVGALTQGQTELVIQVGNNVSRIVASEQALDVLGDELNTLGNQVDILTLGQSTLANRVQNHSHSYLTSEDNEVKAHSGPATFPAAPEPVPASEPEDEKGDD